MQNVLIIGLLILALANCIGSVFLLLEVFKGHLHSVLGLSVSLLCFVIATFAVYKAAALGHPGVFS